MESNCVSFNLKASQIGNHYCELNNATHEGHKEEMEESQNFVYRAAKNACVNKPCKNNATCQSGFTDKGYRCLCTSGFKGPNCESDIDECAEGKHNCSATAVCKNTEGSYNCTCNPGYYGDGTYCKEASTCKEIFDTNLYKENKAYILSVESKKIPIYCHMTNTGPDECGDGGWTLVMKINGSKTMDVFI